MNTDNAIRRHQGMGPLLKLASFVFAGIGCGITIVCFHSIVLQIYRLECFSETTGEIVSKDVDIKESTTDHGRKFRIYRPLVVYKYSVNGIDFTSDNLAPLFTENRGDKKWYDSVKSTIPPPEHAVSVYYDSNAPHHSFILRNHDFEPYFLALIGFPIFFSVFTLLYFEMDLAFGNKELFYDEETNRYNMLSVLSYQYNGKIHWWVWVLTVVVGVCCAASYYLFAKPPFVSHSHVTFLIYFCVCVIWGFLLFKQERSLKKNMILDG